LTARRGEQPVASIRIETLNPEVATLWRTVVKVARELGEDRSWCLVGGLMVGLFAIEAGQEQRATSDIDILGDARKRPSATERISRRLEGLGAELHQIGGLDAQLGFRFDVDGQIVDVLAPDGLAHNRPPRTRGSTRLRPHPHY
jgi:hypothetical protein